MLDGWFEDASGRPYMESRLIIPRLSVAMDISFCVDTGADGTLLMPADVVRIGLDYRVLQGDVPSVGIGGISHSYEEEAVIVFSSASILYGYHFELLIPEYAPEIADLPSLLGRNILNQWQMNYNPTANQLECTVISSDFTIPLRQSDA